MDEETIAFLKKKYGTKMEKAVIYLTNEDEIVTSFFPGMHSGNMTSSPQVKPSTPTQEIRMPEGVYLVRAEIKNMSPVPILFSINPQHPYAGPDAIYSKGKNPIAPGATFPVDIPDPIVAMKFDPNVPGMAPNPKYGKIPRENVREWYLTCNVQNIKPKDAVDVTVSIGYFRGALDEGTP